MENPQEEDFDYKKNALAMRLQQRRPRKVLAEQGIIPPLKTPGTYFPQIQRLERARKQDFLNHAIQVRPERDLLIQKHILEDTSASSSIVANQKDLKKAKLVDDLNDKIALRPGVFELVERNIIPATEDVQEALKGGHLQYKKIADFIEEDSSDALSPEQQPPPTSSPPLFQLTTSGITSSLTAAQASTVYTTKNDTSSTTRSSSSSSLFTQSNSHPYLSRQSSKGSKVGQSGLMPRMVNSRKKKDKPKFKKFKYHQYVPPDQQGKPNENKLPSLQDDTPYARLLEQQQMYLQLQIMNKQYSNQINTQRCSEPQKSSFNQQRIVSPPPAPPFTQTMKLEKPRNLNTPLTQSKLDDMKVSELKEELKLRGQKVTGTKEILVERLKPFCVSSDGVYLSNLDEGNSNFSIGNTSMLSEGSLSNGGQSVHQPTTTLYSVASASSNNTGMQTAFPINPNTVHSHKVARMPAPERHKIVFEQEKLTMPTWHHAEDPHGMQTVTAPSQPNNPFMEQELSKDKMLEKQQKQINDLKRMVELHRKQLQQLHNHKPTTKETVQVMTKPMETAHLSKTLFQFPTASNTNHRSAGQPTNSQIPPESRSARQVTNPPNYDQAFEMVNSNDGVISQDGSRDMDDLFELLTANGDISSPPIVTRVLLNDHNSYHGINNRTGNPPKTYPLQSEFVAREQSQLQREVHQNQINKMPQEYMTNGGIHTDYLPPQTGRIPDLTKMLVDSAGDALMDTSNFPPAQHQYSNLNLDQHAVNYSRGSARNSIDSGVIYSTPHYSPMDTSNMDTGNHMINDLRLSSSSIDSGEPTLNAVSLSPSATPPRLKHPQNTHLNHRSSPKSIYGNSLIKSASQELLSTSQTPSVDNNSMNSELGWLDLTLGSAVGGPPSPGNPFETVGLDEQTLYNSQHSNPVSTHGSRDADLNLCLGGASGNLTYPPTLNNLDPQSWDHWEGLLNSSYNA